VSVAGTHEGVVSAHRAGFGFVRIEGFEESVFLPPPQMNGVLHGDRVRVSVAQDRTGRYSGRVERIVARGTSAFLATVELRGRSPFVHSADRRLSIRCAVAPKDLSGARDGDWVIAQITRYGADGALSQAKVVKRLDPAKPVEMATEAAVARFELPHDFSNEALREAEAYGHEVDPTVASQRVDLRPLPLVTIDGEDARDFDDAVYAEPHPHGFRLLVAIADVSYYVRLGTALDASARERGTSVYFPTRVIPMLPTALSNRLCSLEPHVDRLCFVADMLVSRSGQLGEAKFYPAVMRSAARLTYDQAFAALFERKREAREQLGALVERLEPLLDAYRALVKARHRRGALEFDAPEAEFDIDAGGQVAKIFLYARNEAHKLIEECMILANVAVARELERRKVGTLYRVHGQPEEKKLDQLLATLTALDVAAEIPETVTPRDLRAISERLGNAPERAFVESLVVRSMPQAVYQPSNIGHFGLALKQYAHFTSPIRRYPDLVVHRNLRALLSADDPHAVRIDAERLSLLGADLSRLEKRADESDRYVAQFLKCAFLRDRIGQTFDGLVTTVVEFGCFVQLTDFNADGLLHIDSLRDDRYTMDTQGRAWVGAATGRRLSLGGHVRVIVTSVNPVEGLIDLQLDPTSPATADEGRTAQRPHRAAAREPHGIARHPDRASKTNRSSRSNRDRKHKSRHR
jgi:ribonuclease R